MNWFKQHADTIAIVTVVLGCFWNLNEKIWDVNQKIAIVEKDMAVVRAVLCIKNILPSEMAANDSRRGD
jgi:hypothetical protein